MDSVTTDYQVLLTQPPPVPEHDLVTVPLLLVSTNVSGLPPDPAETEVRVYPVETAPPDATTAGVFFSVGSIMASAPVSPVVIVSAGAYVPLLSVAYVSSAICAVLMFDLACES